jgi:hypothetical protein
LNNVIRYADWRVPTSSAVKGGILYSDISHSVVGNNVIALGTDNALRVRQFPAGVIFPPAEDCDYMATPPGGGLSYPSSLDVLPSGYRRAWFNNRELSGTLIDVRFWFYDVNGYASQQQWRD